MTEKDDDTTIHKRRLPASDACCMFYIFGLLSKFSRRLRLRLVPRTPTRRESRRNKNIFLKWFFFFFFFYPAARRLYWVPSSTTLSSAMSWLRNASSWSALLSYAGSAASQGHPLIRSFVRSFVRSLTQLQAYLCSSFRTRCSGGGMQVPLVTSECWKKN